MNKFYVAALACVSLVAVNANGADSYAAAYKTMQETGKPLVVLIGADWCPACQSMKTGTMPQLAQDGKLNDVAFAIVNIDHQARIGRAMMEGGLIPQLVIYTKTDDGWKRDRLIGGQSAESVQQFLASHVKARPAVETVGQRQ
ncbi:MAG: thioredoxin family protein [Pirellulales bacterium]|nr:thioredoxin family protein [Pirellulales bacterium]